ncbi:DUF4439 domain-containing protein [Streptacidiphilus monticola]|uniref:DUF4439 domain-containing protein n=1 Tax=Streptacidiphilus monticola TaxID=2161674 RepID=A0ABW1GDT6_9ACTN
MTALPRRRVLALLAAVPPLLTACGPDSPAPAGSAAPTPVDPDTRARTTATGALRPLVAAYAVLTPPQPAATATALTQLQALTGRQTTTPGATASASATATARATATATPAAVAQQELALARLVTAQVPRTSPSLARLLASVAAGATLRAVTLGARVPLDDRPIAAGSAGPAPSPAELEALQGALAAEHAAVYGYGVLGAQLGGKARARAQSCYALHRELRDALSARISAAGGRPVAAAAGYRLPFAVADAASAQRLAATLEDRLAAVWANGVRAATGARRGEAAGHLLRAALRAQAWGAALSAFPGLPERAASAPR